MENILVDVFWDFSNFSKYASGIDTNMDLDDLRASGMSAKKRMEIFFTRPVFTAILAEEKEGRINEALKTALANMTMATQLIFDSIHRRREEVNVYKYELEAMKRAYMEEYYFAMDTIVQELMSADVPDEDTTSAKALWRKSRYFGLIDSCKIKTADAFDSIYPIDLSYLFFFRLLPLQKESLDENIGNYYAKMSEDNRDRIEPMLNLALAKKTVAKALRRFDILEFPPTIKNLFDESHASRSGKDEHDGAAGLADRLDRESGELMSNVDTLLSAEGNIDVSSYSAYNDENDNIVMLP